MRVQLYSRVQTCNLKYTETHREDYYTQSDTRSACTECALQNMCSVIRCHNCTLFCPKPKSHIHSETTSLSCCQTCTKNPFCCLWFMTLPNYTSFFFFKDWVGKVKESWKENNKWVQVVWFHNDRSFETGMIKTKDVYLESSLNHDVWDLGSQLMYEFVNPRILFLFTFITGSQLFQICIIQK